MQYCYHCTLNGWKCLKDCSAIWVRLCEFSFSLPSISKIVQLCYIIYLWEGVILEQSHAFVKTVSLKYQIFSLALGNSVFQYKNSTFF